MKLRKRIETIMREDTGSGPAGLRGFLSALSMLYGVGVRLRKTTYNKGWLSTSKLDCVVVSVGNLTLGGTGKTPMTTYLARRLQSCGYRVAVISRGYKGTAQERGGVVSDGNGLLMRASVCGDEAFMMAKSLENIPVLVGRDRFAVGKKALEMFQPQVILLDDAFQHIRLARDLDLVLLDAVKPFGNGRLFPRGTLREGPAALKRSSALVLTRAGKENVESREIVARVAPGKPVFQCSHRPVVTDMIPVVKENNSGTRVAGTPSDMQAVSGKRGYLFSGIADNRRFRRTVERAGNRVCGASFFEDHHGYTRTELNQIMSEAVDSGADMILTTEKDLSRIEPDTKWPLDLVVVGVEINFSDDGFDRYINNTLKKLAKG